MSDLQLYEFANEAFYLAFEAKDYNAMEHIWCEQGQPVCLHPGWPALVGRESILDSWKNILGNPEQLQVSFVEPIISPIDESSAAVVCYEKVGDEIMVATNVFKIEQDRPRLYIHQAGFCPQR
jgi:hypothetical protein